MQDPTEESRWRRVFRVLYGMDDEIARIYAENGIPDLKPTWVMEIIRLHVRGPMTIAELARSLDRTHSALSQKVAAMRAAGSGTILVTGGRFADHPIPTLATVSLGKAALRSAATMLGADLEPDR